jgi:hypothetical protein
MGRRRFVVGVEAIRQHGQPLVGVGVEFLVGGVGCKEKSASTSHDDRNWMNGKVKEQLGVNVFFFLLKCFLFFIFE